MVTCFLKYVIDPYKLDEFESYARAWIPIVNRMGGSHHGYYLPHEGANNMAYALFSFPRLAAYEAYSEEMKRDPECLSVFATEQVNRSIISYERSFMRPVTQGQETVKKSGTNALKESVRRIT
ncbi:NIPSNAP family protein [Klebsiella pneumoniae]|uniref:NIPSNAP family protein n=1 Tax=Klebsiella pneumoniae TaxID=573 RepID=UPI000E2CE5EB|nr:NIPSNAP family protein [Klebsiella pneumoniae]SXK01080.1 NIPSNAP [Klebsiella pneumoniae]